MKTAILQCLQQFSSKNKNRPIFKTGKITVPLQNCAKRSFYPVNNIFMKTAILQCLQQFSSKNRKNVYHDQFLKSLCKIVQNVRFSL